MKTIIEKIFQLRSVAQPSNGRLYAKTARRKEKAAPGNGLTLSPECFNVRGVSAREREHARRNPAP